MSPRPHTQFVGQSLTNKLRTVVTVGAVSAAALACSGVASAATVARAPAPGTSVVASQPTTVAMYIDPNHVGSAGIAGFDDAKCQAIVNAHNADEQTALKATKAGDQNLALGSAELADDLAEELGDNCLVID